MTPGAPVQLDDILTQVAKDKGIDKSILIATLEDAIATAAKKHFGQDRRLTARYEQVDVVNEKGEATGRKKWKVSLYQTITIVEQVVDPIEAVNQFPVEQSARLTGDGPLNAGDELDFQIFYDDEDAQQARAQDEQYGDVLGLKTFRRGFGRIAAQTAKQVLLQRTRDVERENVYNEYKDRKGEIVTGIARRLERGNLIVDLGRAEAVLPVREQV
ncbi:MAG: transcription termination factor NusA, partial [Archangium sp.]|nr:transcription termination factor NusA [Archangium sp.]